MRIFQKKEGVGVFWENFEKYHGTFSYFICGGDVFRENFKSIVVLILLHSRANISVLFLTLSLGFVIPLLVLISEIFHFLTGSTEDGSE